MDVIQLDTVRAKRMIQELDLDFVEQRLINVEGFTAERAREAIESYRNLLTLQVEYPSRALAPPLSADKALHAHILHTKRYAEDMQTVFGRFLHHDPANTSEEARDFTRRAFLEHFGTTVDTFAMCLINVETEARHAA